MGLPSIRTSVSESRWARKGSFVLFSLRSISIRESRLFRSESGVGEPGEGQCSGVWGGGVVGWGSGSGGGSGIGGVSGLSLPGKKSVAAGAGG